MGKDAQPIDALDALTGTIADEAPDWMRCDDAEDIGCVATWTTCQNCPLNKYTRRKEETHDRKV